MNKNSSRDQKGILEAFFDLFRAILRLLIFLFLWVVLPIIILDFILGFIKENLAKDDISRLLIPYHNDYFLFADYYLTVESLNNSWFFRFSLFILVPILLFAFINRFLSIFIKEDTKFVTYLIKAILFTIIMWGLGKTFFLPAVFTCIDTDSKQLIYKQYNLWGLKIDSKEIPFAYIDSITFDIERQPWRNEVIEYVRVYVHTPSSSKLLIGVEEISDLQFNSYPARDEYIKNAPFSAEQNERGQKVVKALYRLIGRD